MRQKIITQGITQGKIKKVVINLLKIFFPISQAIRTEKIIQRIFGMMTSITVKIGMIRISTMNLKKNLMISGKSGIVINFGDDAPSAHLLQEFIKSGYPQLNG